MGSDPFILLLINISKSPIFTLVTLIMPSLFLLIFLIIDPNDLIFLDFIPSLS